MTRASHLGDPGVPDRAEPDSAAAAELRATWRDHLPSRALELRARITAMPGGSWERDAELLIAIAWTYRNASSLNLFIANSYLDAADALIGHDDPLRAHWRLARSTMLRGLGRLDEALALALQVMQSPPSPRLPFEAHLVLEARARIAVGICLALLGDLTGAEENVRHGVGISDASKPTASLVEGLGWLAIFAWYAGAPNAPGEHLDRARELGSERGLIDDIAGIPARLAEALMANDRADFDDAADLLEAIRGMTVGTEYHIMLLHALSIARGGVEGSSTQTQCLQEARILLHSWPSPSLHHLQHEVFRATMLLQAGALGGAREAIVSLAALVHDVSDPRHAFCLGRFEGRLAMHAGEHQPVLDATNACRALGDAHAMRTLACVDALRAAAHLRLGNASIAARKIDYVLDNARRTGWQRPLLVLPASVLRLVLASARTRPQPQEVTAMIDELADRLPGQSPDHTQTLSDRERVILTHLVEGHSRQEISTRLHVSPNTVKSQTRSLYRKLGAAGRHEAIERAAKLGISA